MKKYVISLLVCLFLGTALMAQEGQKHKEEKKMEQKHSLTESVIMEKGKLMHFQNGKKTPVTSEMQFADMQVSPDGTIKMKDGKSMKLKEGECCDNMGMVHKDCMKLMKKS